MLAEATAALSVLDAGTLERLSARAALLDTQTVQTVRATPPAGQGLAELEARFQVFKQVLTATGENLQALARSKGADAYSLATGWLPLPNANETKGPKGHEAADLPCTWPRGRVAQARALRERAEPV